ncbi:hypothetical protein [Pseudomonas sp. AU11447]|uniref:hypothetical protein n=1 Tax=unclassified Pseudomonas TaxID=196821 RepID=UPI00353259C4
MNMAAALNLGGCLLLFSLTGCAQNQNSTQAFSPPPGGEQVTVTVKVPQDLAADTLRVMYRSQKCQVKRSGADWTSYEEDGRHAIEVVPQRQGNSDLYVAKLDRSGGGACQWNLSNVTFGVHYENTAQFGEGVTYGYGGGVIVIFDNNLPQRRSMDEVVDVSGDVVVREDYYPWVIETFIGGHEKTLVIMGRQNVFSYRSSNARSVVFEPILHSGLVVRTIGVKSDGAGTSENIYPDGTREFSGYDPSLRRLKIISESMNSR